MYKEQDEVSYSTFLPIYNTGTRYRSTHIKLHSFSLEKRKNKRQNLYWFIAIIESVGQALSGENSFIVPSFCL